MAHSSPSQLQVPTRSVSKEERLEERDYDQVLADMICAARDDGKDALVDLARRMGYWAPEALERNFWQGYFHHDSITDICNAHFSKNTPENTRIRNLFNELVCIARRNNESIL